MSGQSASAGIAPEARTTAISAANPSASPTVAIGARGEKAASQQACHAAEQVRREPAARHDGRNAVDVAQDRRRVVLQDAERHRGEEEERKGQPHRDRGQEREVRRLARRVRRWRQGRRHVVRAVGQPAAPQPQEREHGGAYGRRAEASHMPAGYARQAGHEDGRHGPAQVARHTVHREGVPEARLAHSMVEEREVRRMEDAVAHARDGRAQDQHRIARGQAQHHARQRQGPDAEEEHALRRQSGPRQSRRAPARRR